MIDSQPPTPPSARRRRERKGAQEPGAAAKASPDAKLGFLPKLIILGWIAALLYFPSGLLHGVLGAVVYLRDMLLLTHLGISIYWLSKQRQLNWVAKHSWVILVTPVLLIPAVLTSSFTLEALRTCKWSLCWLDWIVLGHQLRLNKEWGQWLKLLCVITLVMMGIELVAGVIEWRTGNYLISTSWGERTALGVMRGNDQMLDGRIRIRGLQRDVFSFANLMGMNAVLGMAAFTIFREQRIKLAALGWTALFGLMMSVSGGRSALFGAFAAALYAAWLVAWPVAARRYARRYIVGWIVIAIALSCIGVGKFTDFVGNTVLGGSYVGDSESAYMRDQYWVKMRKDFVSKPLILVTGGPIGSIVDHRIDVMFHWADNQLLWNLYHLGIAGALATMFFFYKVLEDEPREQDRMARQALILFLVFVVGEGIARESMTFMGCLPLFILCGYDNAGSLLARRAALSGNRIRLVRPAAEGGLAK
jgi:hypothetical protein